MFCSYLLINVDSYRKSTQLNCNFGPCSSSLCSLILFYGRRRRKRTGNKVPSGTGVRNFAAFLLLHSQAISMPPFDTRVSSATFNCAQRCNPFSVTVRCAGSIDADASPQRHCTIIVHQNAAINTSHRWDKG